MLGLKLNSTWFAVIIVASGTSFVSAEELSNQANEPSSLTQTLTKALNNNSQLASARSGFKAIHRTQFVSFASMLPQVSAYAIGNYTEHMEDDILANERQGQDDSYGIRVDHELFTSGKNLNAFRSKRAEIIKERYNLDSQEQSTLLSAVQVHFDVIRDRAVYELNQKNVAVLSQQLQAVKDRFEVGIVTRTDIAQSEARFAGARSNLLLADTAVQSSLATYLQVVGEVAPVLTNVSPLPELPSSLSEALDIGRAESPMLNSAKQNARSAKLSAYSTVSATLPQVKVSGIYSRYDNKTPSLIQLEEGETFSVQATVTMPLFSGGRNIANISAARHASNALAQNVHATASAVQQSIVVSWHQNLAATSVVLARNEQIQASKIALEGVRQENMLGTRTTLDVLNAEQALLDARVNLSRAERDQYVAAYGLLASVGRLSGSYLGLN